jgi:predicted dehydrogenase
MNPEGRMNRRSFVQTGTAGMLYAQAARAQAYRVVLIGHTSRGNYGHDWDLAWKSVPKAQVVAVADPDESGRRRAMARSGAARGYADYREMLAKGKP